MTEAILVLAVVVVIVAIASILFKNNHAPIAIVMLIAAFIGALVAGMGIRVREVVEGMFGYFYPLLSVMVGMLLVKFLYDGGGFDWLFSKIAGRSGVLGSLLMLLFITIPGLITGTLTASLLTTGAIAGRYLLKNGMGKVQAASFVGAGAFLGMLLPPISLPTILTTGTAATSSGYFGAYTGYTVPLLFVALPAFLIFGIVAAKNLPTEKAKAPAEGGVASIVPLIVVFVLLLCHDFLAAFLPFLGYPLIFAIGAVLALLLKAKRYNPLTSVAGAFSAIAPAIAIALTIGSISEVFMMTGVIGEIGAALYFSNTTMLAIVFIVIIIALGLVFDAPLPWLIGVVCINILSNLSTYTGVNTFPTAFSAVLAISAIVSIRHGFTNRLGEAIGAESLEAKKVVSGMALPVLLVLAMGLVLVFAGDALAFLRI